ncbi:MAG: sigma-70 family RNA polymerase sigma factor [Acidobacteriota bacterium]
MTEPDAGGVTRLLLQWKDGDREALEELAPIVYSELRRLARHYMSGENAGHLLQTTALVHEAYLKLVGLDVEWRGRVHFFAIAARLMRRVLVDYARERRAEKRGGGAPVVLLDEARIGGVDDAGPAAPDILALDAALEKLAAFDERKSQVVELRFFAGLTLEEIAEVMEKSRATVARDLQVAKAWLGRELQQELKPETAP